MNGIVLAFFYIGNEGQVVEEERRLEGVAILMKRDINIPEDNVDEKRKI